MVRDKLKLFKPEEIKRSVKPLADQLPSSRPVAEPEILPPEPATIDQYVSVIGALWADAQSRFMRIGECLDRAQLKLSAEEFAAMAARLPFGKVVRSQLMQAYRAIKSGLLPREVAAAGYSVVYLAASLAPEERHQAMSEGIIRPDMRRQDLAAFKRRVRAAQEDRRTGLERRRTRLLAERERIDRELAEIARELGPPAEGA